MRLWYEDAFVGQMNMTTFGHLGVRTKWTGLVPNAESTLQKQKHVDNVLSRLLVSW